MDQLQEIAKNVQEGYSAKVKAAVEQAISQGVSPHDILHAGLLNGMSAVADKFKCGEMFLPEVLAVAGAMKAGMAIVKPLLVTGDAAPKGKILIGTVRGDMHDIGKNLVGIMLQCGGYEVVDLGIDVRTEKFVEAVEKEKPDVVGLSALLTTTMVHMRGVIEALAKNQLRDKVKVIIGGAPISRNYAQEIQADGYARDAAMAVDVVRDLLHRS